MQMVIGLGNPGQRYEGTRHNAGFLVVERLADRWGIKPDRRQLGSLVGDGRIGTNRVLLARPQSYMNRSGTPVRALLDYFKLEIDQLVVVHDEIDLPFSTVKVKVGGGLGGHNGLKDLARHMGKDFSRVRVGVGRPPEGWKAADYVLSQWTTEEKTSVGTVVDQACDAVETVLSDGPDAAMNRFNARVRESTGSTPDTDSQKTQ